VAERAGVDRKTARRYVEAAQATQAAGLVRDGGPEQLTDALIGTVVSAVRPARAGGHGAAWELLMPEQARISEWIEKERLQPTNIHGKLARLRIVVPYRTLYRFAVERCGFTSRPATLRVADGAPGVECQVDFGRLGLIPDPATGRRRVCHALVFTACLSRHCFVWPTFAQTTAAVIEGFEAAWAFFGGCLPRRHPGICGVSQSCAGSGGVGERVQECAGDFVGVLWLDSDLLYQETFRRLT